MNDISFRNVVAAVYERNHERNVCILQNIIYIPRELYIEEKNQ